jgi:DtxR family Mn-dependent transcriptional regulator
MPGTAMDEQTLTQHALKLFAECEYDEQSITALLLSDKLAIIPEQAEQLLQKLQTAGLVEADSLILTSEGREYAMHVLQAHRLYETYLARKTGYPESSWHQIADQREHQLSRDDVEQLAEELGHPRFDPHGDPIPSSSGEMPAKRGKPLIDYSAGWTGRVVHIEDQPALLYSRIVKSGITTDTVLRIKEKNGEELSVEVEGQIFCFPVEVAGQITVVALKPGETFDDSIERLSTLQLGEEAEIVGMSSLCRGLERNRLLDLGVVPGTVTCAELLNPSGSPVGYRIRGACIALRREQAERIRIRKLRK